MAVRRPAFLGRRAEIYADRYQRSGCWQLGEKLRALAEGSSRRSNLLRRAVPVGRWTDK
jgi:hypothetical protein